MANRLSPFAKDCLLIAQDTAPKDTGNLAFNATRKVVTQYGFNIVYNEADAFYIKYQQGPQGPPKNHGFIDSTVVRIVSFLTAKLNNSRNQINVNRKALSKLAVNNPARDKALIASQKRALRRL